MPICPICDDTGLQNADELNPVFCYCAAGKQGKRQWDASRISGRQGKVPARPSSFIDIAELEQVNASVDAMRASLFGNAAAEPAALAGKHPAVQLLYQLAHAGHEVSVVEATQLYELAKTLEQFLVGLTPPGRTMKR